MKQIPLAAVLLTLTAGAHAEPVVYTNEAVFRAALAAHGYSIVHESFEDDVAWADSRNSIIAPGSTPSVTSQGLVWTSNYSGNDIATGDVGGSAPDGTYAIYSLPHGTTTDSGLYCDNAPDPVPVECYQNDGLKVQSATGERLYAFGGRIDTANSGKISFLLDGVDINGNDTDNIDNWQREGEFADSWQFVGVIDTDGFNTVELRELRGKDFQQVLLFADDFSVGVSQQAVAGTVAGFTLNFTFCKDLTTGSKAVDRVFGAAADWNCSDNGLVAASADTAIALMAGTRSVSTDPVSGTVTGLSPVLAICSNTTTRSQVFVPLAGTGNWDCEAGGLVTSPGDKLRIILYGTVQ